MLKSFILLMVLCFACGSAKEREPKETQTTKKDTISPKTTPLAIAELTKEAQLDSNLVKLMAKFQDTTFAPFGKISPKEFEQTKRGKALQGKEVKLLTQHLADHWSLDFPRFYLQKFYEIDAAKRKKQYKNWLQENGSEGNIIQAQVYANRKIDFYGKTDLMVWSLHHQTVEACPFAKGQVIFATIIHDGNVGKTFVLASYLSAGDAPISSEATVQTLLFGDASMTLAYNKVVYEDNTLIEKKRKTCKVRIQAENVNFEELQ